MNKQLYNKNTNLSYSTVHNCLPKATNGEATHCVVLSSLSHPTPPVLYRKHTKQFISVGLNKRLLLAQHVPHREHISNL